MSDPVEITDENFQQEVLNSETPVLVDFWAEGVDHANNLLHSWKKLLRSSKIKLKSAKWILMLTEKLQVNTELDQSQL